MVIYGYHEVMRRYYIGVRRGQVRNPLEQVLLEKWEQRQQNQCHIICTHCWWDLLIEQAREERIAPDLTPLGIFNSELVSKNPQSKQVNDCGHSIRPPYHAISSGL